MKKLRHLLPDHARRLLLVTVAAASSAAAALVPTEWRQRQSLDVATPGFVRLELPETTFGACQSGLTDLRLLDPNGRETAYLLDQPPVMAAQSRPAEAFKARVSDGVTILTIDTGSDEPLESLVLATPHPHFLRSARVEISDDGTAWSEIDAGVPLFRQWGTEQLELALGRRHARHIRVTLAETSGRPVPFTGAVLKLSAGPAPSHLPVSTELARRDEFAGETVLTIRVGAANLPLASLSLDATDPLFMRRVTVSVREPDGLTTRERELGHGTLYRVSPGGGVPSRAKLDLEFLYTSAASEFQLHIHNDDAPPLGATNVQVRRRPIALLFNAPSAGRYTLLSGNPQTHAPRYDLSAFASELRETAIPLSPGAMENNPGHQPRDAFAAPEMADIPLSGAPLDVSAWTQRKSVLISSIGVQELELDAAALAGARRDFADLRLVRSGNQIPFLLEQSALTRALDLTFTPETDPRRPSVSVWRVPLPHTSLPAQRLAIHASTPLFSRNFRLYEKSRASDGRTYERVLASGTWSRTPEPDSAGSFVFTLQERPTTDSLLLETDNGDNPAITLTRINVSLPVVRLVFKAATIDGTELHYGHDHAVAPRYDLSLVAGRLLTASRQTARLGSETKAPPRTDFLAGLRGGPVFWGALALVVIVLLVIVTKLLPKTDAQ